jgi:hypothetical protein
MINSSFDIALTQAEIDQLVTCLFDKNLPTPRPASVPTPFSSENPPPVVRVFAFSDALYLHCLINLFCL